MSPTAHSASSIPHPAHPGRLVATLAILLGLIVAAFETTVVSAAMPTVTRELGDVALYPWVFSAFLVASTVGVLVCGKLADRVGRRPVFVGGIGLFLLGSILCGESASVLQLVAFRVVQGLGAGAIQPIAMTISADLYTLRERARIQTLFTSVWGAANVLGPVIGGMIVMHWSWRWVFFVNVPFAVLAAALLLASYRDPPRTVRGVPSVWGAVLAGLAVGAVLLSLEPVHSGASNAIHLALLSVAIATSLAFVVQQRHSADPLLPPVLLPDRVVHASLATGMFAGAVLYGCTAYVPLWMAQHGHHDALAAGASLVPLLAGWAVGSSFGVHVLIRRGMRASVSGGLAIVAVGAAALWLAVRADAGLPFAWAALAVVGLGLGPAASTGLIAVQTHVPWRLRAVVTSAGYATRTLGGGVAVSLIGVAQHRFGASSSLQVGAVAVVALVGFVTLRLVTPQGLVTPLVIDGS